MYIPDRQIQRFWRPFWLLACLWLLVPAGAILASPLHEAEMPVADQSTAARAPALREALGAVLVRMSGDRGVAALPETADLLTRADAYVQQFSYRPAAPETGAPWVLHVRFDGAALEHALRARGLPFWGGERPETLVWLAVEQNGRRWLLDEPDSSEARMGLEAAARRRGLPLILPLMDLEDRARVGHSDVWGGFLEPVLEASRRYRPQALLIGRMHQSTTGAWQASWTLRAQDSEQRWSGQGRDPGALAAEGVERVADELAARFAVVDSGADGRVRITVSGVASLADYARLNRYFTSLSAVRSAQLQALSGERADYLLQLQGDVGGFERALALGAVVRPDPDAGMRHYRLLP